MSRRRVLIIVLASLCFGTALNIGVAWWHPAKGGPRYSFTTSSGVNIRPPGQASYLAHFPFTIFHRPGIDAFQVSVYTAADSFDRLISSRIVTDLASRTPPPVFMGAGTIAMPPIKWPEWMPLPPDDGSRYTLWRWQASGWPMRSLASLIYTRAGELQPRSAWAIRIAPGLPSALADEPVLPLRPLFLGFTINSLLGASLLAIPWLFVSFWTARRQRTRGHCPSCGYSLEGLPPGRTCPECNAPIQDASPSPSTQNAVRN